MLKNKKERGLIVVKSTKFDKIRRKIMTFLWGNEYELIEYYEQLIQRTRPKKIIIPKEIKGIR